MAEYYIRNSTLYLLLKLLPKKKRDKLVRIVLASLDPASHRHQAATILLHTYLKDIRYPSQLPISKMDLSKEAGISIGNFNRLTSLLYQRAEQALDSLVLRHPQATTLHMVPFFIEQQLVHRAQERLNILRRHYTTPSEIWDAAHHLNSSTYFELYTTWCSNAKNWRVYNERSIQELDAHYWIRRFRLMCHCAIHAGLYGQTVGCAAFLPPQGLSAGANSPLLDCYQAVQTMQQAQTYSTYQQARTLVLAQRHALPPLDQRLLLLSLMQQGAQLMQQPDACPQQLATQYWDHLYGLDLEQLPPALQLKQLATALYLLTWLDHSTGLSKLDWLQAHWPEGKTADFVWRLYHTYWRYRHQKHDNATLANHLHTPLPRNSPPTYAFFYYYSSIRYAVEVEAFYDRHLENKLKALKSYLNHLKRKAQVDPTQWQAMAHFHYFLHRWVMLSPNKPRAKQTLKDHLMDLSPAQVAYWDWLIQLLA